MTQERPQFVNCDWCTKLVKLVRGKCILTPVLFTKTGKLHHVPLCMDCFRLYRIQFKLFTRDG